MAFTPKTSKSTSNKWEPNPNLPEVKYKIDGRIHLTTLARDIAEKLPVKRFRDLVEFEDVVNRAFSQVWPQWEEYFGPLVRQPFERDVYKAVFNYAKIELGDKKNDNRSNTR